MRRRELLLGMFGAVVYVACGGDDDKPGDGTGSSGGTSSGSSGDGGVPLGPPEPTSVAADSDRLFPQGLASGDPRPDQVVLWTRVEPSAVNKPADAEILLEFLIAKDEALTQIIARGTVNAVPDHDHAVKVVPTGLTPGQVYYYRFELRGSGTTQVGRTKTAPDANADVPVTFMMAACQDYIGRYWHAWKAFLEERVDVDFVLFLGDYIYESVNDDRFQASSPDRAIKLPDGADISPKKDGSRIVADTLADYRTLYKTYRSDPVLKEVHRLYPFIVTWDDHEFADDCWQDHTNAFNGEDPDNPGNPGGDEKNTPRRTAANRAFWEHQPIDIPYKENLTFPFDIQIYRTLRWGKHVELFMTDQRSYRADHLIPEGKGTVLETGKFLDYTTLGSRIFIRKEGFDPLEANAKPTMLGAAQKAWFIDAVKSSNATWKVWGNEVQLYQYCMDLKLIPGVPDKIFGLEPYVVYLNGDQWDGFRSERAEILSAFENAGVSNLLVCTGDIHSFYASELHVDFDNPKPKPMGVEYVAAGISSASLGAVIGSMIPSDSPLSFLVSVFTSAARTAITDTNSEFLRYADPDSYGFALMRVDAAKAECSFIQIGDPRDKNDSGVKARFRFVTESGSNTIKQL